MIRILSPSDAAEFRRIRLQALVAHPEAFGSTEREEIGKAATYAARLAPSAHPDAIFGCFDCEHLSGIAGFFRHLGEKRCHRGHLWGVYVEPEARRAGRAESLVRAVLDHARHHVEIVELSVASRSGAAVRLYQKLGFVIYGVESQAIKIDGRYSDWTLMSAHT